MLLLLVDEELVEAPALEDPESAAMRVDRRFARLWDQPACEVRSLESKLMCGSLRWSPDESPKMASDPRGVRVVVRSGR